MADFRPSNFVNITGLLVKKKSEFKLSKTGKEFGKVTLTVRTSENEQHTVDFMQMKYTTDRTTNQQVLNPRYTALQTVANEYVSLEDCKNEEMADVVTISASLDVDHYIPKNGVDVASITKVKGFNVSRVDNKQVERLAEFRIHGVMKKKIPMVDVEGNQDGLKVSLAVPMYAGRVELIDFVVRDENGINWVEDIELNTPFFIGGRVVNEATIIEAPQETTNGWGAKVSRAKTIYRNELEITGIEVCEEIEDENHPLNETFINKGLEARAIKLTEIASTQANQTPSGFGTMGTNVNPSSIPF